MNFGPGETLRHAFAMGWGPIPAFVLTLAIFFFFWHHRRGPFSWLASNSPLPLFRLWLQRRIFSRFRCTFEMITSLARVSLERIALWKRTLLFMGKA